MIVKAFIFCLVLSMWFALVVLGKADSGSFIAALQAILVGGGVFHAVMTNPNGGQGADKP